MSTKRTIKNARGDKGGSCQGQQPQQQQTKKAKCSKCSLDIEDTYDVNCSICDELLCMVCSDLSYEEIDMFKNLTVGHLDILWVCTQCSNKIIDLKNNITITKIMSKEVAIKLESIETTFTKAVQGLEKSIKNIDLAATETNMTKTFAEVLKNEHTKQAENSNGTLKNIMKEQMKEWSDNNQNPNEGTVNAVKSVIQEGRVDQLKESWDKEERDKNIILFKAEESRNEEPENRKKDDEEIVNGMLDALGLEDIDTKAIFRLGRYDKDKHVDSKSRPLKVIFHTKEARDRVMRNVFKLRDAPAKIKSLSIAHDLTLTEREELRKKIDEAKEKSNSSDSFYWKVRGPPWALRLIREKRGNSNVTNNENVAAPPTNHE
jgi:hypothetical protein